MKTILTIAAALMATSAAADIRAPHTGSTTIFFQNPVPADIGSWDSDTQIQYAYGVIKDYAGDNQELWQSLWGGALGEAITSHVYDNTFTLADFIATGSQPDNVTGAGIGAPTCASTTGHCE